MERIITLTSLLVLVTLAAAEISMDNKLSKPAANESRARIMRHDDGFGRYIKFKTDSKDKMLINLEFSVPFLTVPLRQEHPSLPPAPVEVNVRGILLAAGLGAVASIVVPALTGIPGPFAAFMPVTHELPPTPLPPHPWH